MGILTHQNVEVRRQLLRVVSLLPLWDAGVELKLTGLYIKHFYLLSHLHALIRKD